MCIKMSENFDCLAKILTIGDSGVGKSCILERFERGSFRATHVPTIAIDFAFKTVEIGGRRLRMQLWDTAGQERFNTLTASFFKATHGVLLCFSLSDRASFVGTARWIQQVRSLAPKEVVVVLVGNKTDLEDERQVSRKEAEDLAKEMDVEYFETSAFTGQGIDEAFNYVAKRTLSMLDSLRKETGVSQLNNMIDEDKKTKAKCCRK